MVPGPPLAIGTTLTVPKTPLDSMYFMKRPFAPRILLHGKGQLTESAIAYLYNQGLMLIGTDSQSIGTYSDELSAHAALLGYGIAVLENLELRGVPDGRYLLSAAPLKVSGAEGAPCRAILASLSSNFSFVDFPIQTTTLVSENGFTRTRI